METVRSLPLEILGCFIFRVKKTFLSKNGMTASFAPRWFLSSIIFFDLPGKPIVVFRVNTKGYWGFCSLQRKLTPVKNWGSPGNINTIWARLTLPSGVLLGYKCQQNCPFGVKWQHSEEIVWSTLILCWEKVNSQMAWKLSQETFRTNSFLFGVERSEAVLTSFIVFLCGGCCVSSELPSRVCCHLLCFSASWIEVCETRLRKGWHSETTVSLDISVYRRHEKSPTPLFPV